MRLVSLKNFLEHIVDLMINLLLKSPSLSPTRHLRQWISVKFKLYGNMASKLYHVLSVSEFTFNVVTMGWMASNQKTEVIIGIYIYSLGNTRLPFLSTREKESNYYNCDENTCFSCIFKTRCTIGISRPSTLNTTISPTRIGSSL